MLAEWSTTPMVYAAHVPNNRLRENIRCKITEQYCFPLQTKRSKREREADGECRFCDYQIDNSVGYGSRFKDCPRCGLPWAVLTSRNGKTAQSRMCFCGHYWEWEQGNRRYPPCWGGDTWVLTEGGGTMRMKDVTVGTRVRTANGIYRAVSAVWVETIPKDRDNGEVVRWRNLWITSHHPVLVGPAWRFPAEVGRAQPASPLADIIGDVYNLELEGHDDTIVLAGDGSAPAAPLTVSCCIGKYLGPRFGTGIWTRRSTRCPSPCAQCDAVFIDGINFADVPLELRFKTFGAFPQVEYEDKSGFVQWGRPEVNLALDTHGIPRPLPKTIPDQVSGSDLETPPHPQVKVGSVGMPACS